jgi:Tol biopolymer transport system component
MRLSFACALPLALCLVLAGCATASQPAPTATSVSPETTAPPLPSVRQDDITYVRSGSNHIWRVRSDGSEPVQVTTGAGGVLTWSPDHSHVAFIRQADTTSALCVVSASGGRVSTWQFDTLIYSLCYSPDGSRIALAEVDESGAMPTERIAIFDIASGKTTLVRELHDRFTTEMSVSWSPDGTRLLIGMGRQDAEGQRSGILTLGSGRLVWLKTPDACEAHWSPDGRSIVVNQMTQSYTAISIADANGTIRRVLVRGSGVLSGDNSVFGGSYSPNGSRVAYCNNSGIWTIRVDRKDKRLVVAHGGAAAWSAR